MSDIFQTVGGVRPRRSLQKLSYAKRFNARFGDLIPILHDEAYPGDYWKINARHLLRFLPLVSPVLHEVNIKVDYFFVPYRLLWKKFEMYITGGPDGNDETPFPIWVPQSDSTPDPSGNPQGTGKFTLWDYFGLPVGWSAGDTTIRPHDMFRRAYNLIWDEYYRDEDLDTPIYDRSTGDPRDFMDTVLTDRVQRCRYAKDYFTSARPWQQKGDAPAIPIGASGSAFWSNNITLPLSVSVSPHPVSNAGSEGNGNVHFSSNSLSVFNGSGSLPHSVSASGSIPSSALNQNVVSLSAGASFDIAAFRMAFAEQRWMERNARAGNRYVEYLQAHYNDHPTDERLQRPEYIGGIRSPVIFSEVLQTSDASAEQTPLASLAGHGISANEGFAASYRVHEIGVVMGILRIVPKAMYSQGINRQFIKKSRFDFFVPEFENLSEQEVYEAELYATGSDANDSKVFGYAPKYSELRYKPSFVCGDLRDTLSYWHIGRRFENPPSLNSEFVTLSNDNRIFAVVSGSVPNDARNVIVQWVNEIDCFRPISSRAEPGLIDHV